MSQTCETVQIQCEPCEGNPLGFVVINESDFDPETMTKHQAQEDSSSDVEKVLEAGSVKESAKVVAPWAST